MPSTIAHSLTNRQFKRRFGVRRETFDIMLKALQPEWRATPKPGAQPKLDLSDRILVALEYWREYRTYFHISTNWGISESTVCRIVHWVEDKLMQSGQFRLPGKQQLVRGFDTPSVILIDVTETRIERPKRRQRAFYSGKQKYHTLKSQLVSDAQTQQIICTFFGKGRRHDFKLFKASGIPIHPLTESLQDKGDQGMHKLHLNSRVPKKKPRGGKLSAEDKAYNRQLARERVGVEHVNRRLKVFRILSGQYRNRRRRFGLRCNLIAALYNFECTLAKLAN
jgi:DDE superfamily endonuclease/Helix-turn-helix of DDE superfamily endonuclease